MGIRSFLGLKGSWKWAKEQMLQGKVVRSRSWSGTRKLRIDNSENKLLQQWFWMMDYCKLNNLPPAQKWAWEQALKQYNESK